VGPKNRKGKPYTSELRERLAFMQYILKTTEGEYIVAIQVGKGGQKKKGGEPP